MTQMTKPAKVLIVDLTPAPLHNVERGGRSGGEVGRLRIEAKDSP